MYSSYPDEVWTVSTGIYLARDVPLAMFSFPVTPERAVSLPLFIGIMYRLLGFPWFLYFLCSWNALTMAILLLSAYFIGEFFFDKKTGILAALLIGSNWFIGWYGNRLLEDVGMVAFEFLSIAFYCKYLRQHNWKYLFVSGFAAALAILTKESALYLLLPLMTVFMLRKENRKLRDVSMFIVSFIIGLSPFMYVSYIRYGNPLYPIFLRLTQFKGTSPGILFNSSYIDMIPFALGLIVFLILIWSLVLLIKKKLFLFPMWAVYCLAVYVFLIPYGPFDKYMTHYIPIFLLMSAFGLKNVTEACLKKYGWIGIIPVPLALLFTNLYGPPLFYSFSQGAFVMPMFLYQRLRWDKYGAISQLIQQVESKQSDWWFAQLFYNSLGPDFMLIIFTATVILILVIVYLVFTKTESSQKLLVSSKKVQRIKV